MLKVQLQTGIARTVILVALGFGGASLPALAQEKTDTVVVIGKRDQSVDDYAGHVAIIDADDVQSGNIRALDQLDRLAADVTIRQRGARVYDSITVRGQSSVDFYNPTVQVYVDGLPQDQASFAQLLPDTLERVEILYGPHGTLYGRGALGGVINIVTRQPSDAFDAALSGSYGELSQDISARISGGLGNGLSADIALARQEDEGEYVDGMTGARRGDSTDTAGRARIRWAPEGGTWDVTALYGRETIDSDEEQYVPIQAMSSRTTMPVPTGLKLKFDSYGLIANVDLGWARLTSLSSYQDRDLDRTVFGYQSPEAQQHFSQEVRLASKGEADSPLSYVAGVAYEHTDFDFQRPQFQQLSQQEIETLAAFGEATWRFNPQWDVTAGIRAETTDTKADASVGTIATSGKDDSSAISPKLAIGYQLSDATRLYALVSTGFKAGGFTRLVTPLNTSFAYSPEKLKNYEAGFRTNLLDRRLELAGAAYFTKTDDYQLNIGTPANRYLQNVGKAETYGLDLRATVRPTDAATIDASLAFNNAEFTAFADPFNPGVDYTGNSLPYAPEFTATLGASYRFDLGGALGTLTPRLSASHASEIWFDETNTIGEGAVTLVSAAFDWKINDNVGFNAYLNNIGDELFATYGFASGGQTYVQLGRGREAGIRLTLKN